MILLKQNGSEIEVITKKRKGTGLLFRCYLNIIFLINQIIV